MPSIHISENPLSNCTCTNHTKSKNEKHHYLCQAHQDRLTSPHQIYNSQNQYLSNATGNEQQQMHLNQQQQLTALAINQLNQINQLIQSNQSNPAQQRNSIQSIPLNLINTPSKTPSKESIYQQSDFNSPHACLPPIESPNQTSMGKCESIAHSLVLSQQQTLKRPSFAHISPQNAISNSSTSNNLMANAQRDRLFSVGPSFHIQFKHPNAYGWQQRSSLERNLIIAIIVLFLSFLFMITGSHLLRTCK